MDYQHVGSAEEVREVLCCREDIKADKSSENETS
jgi:hypothetical protein